MFLFARAVTYAILFVSIVLVFVPARLLSWFGIGLPQSIGIQQICAMIVSGVGAFVALWCVLTFVQMGRGTPAPFDSPRNMVVQGPYRIVRNPMYVGAGCAVIGAALFFGSLQLLAYAGLFFLLAHLFVVFYEEPRLRRSFGQEYSAYCRTVKRWLPKL